MIIAMGSVAKRLGLASTITGGAVLLALSACVFSHELGAQGASAAPPSGTVLFICEHGTVKSLLAKVLFEEYAKEVGLKMEARSRGTNLEPMVPPWMHKALAADGISVGTWLPQALTPVDLREATYVVSFDIPRALSAPALAPRAQWDGLPSVSQDYSAGRDAIKAKVRQLVDSLKRVQVRRQSE
ncbi:MAG: hypothetical protein ABJE47_19325 [bacterium]